MKSNIKIQHATTADDIRRCYETIKFLRPHLTSVDELVERILTQFKEGYRLAYIEDVWLVVDCMGYRILNMLWTRFFYIDDLVTSESSRGKGYGGHLLDYASDYAREQNCPQVHLDSGYQRFDAHRLYLNNGFNIVCHHFSK